MKILKALFIVLLLLIVAFVGISLFLPSKIQVKRSVIINAPETAIYNQINTLKNWSNWSHWHKMDPKMKIEYEGPESGTGAIYKWESEMDSVGKGTLTITDCKEPSQIMTSISFEGMGTSHGGWEISPTSEGTSTSTFMTVELPFYGRIFPGLAIEKMLGQDFDRALSGLKQYCENLPPTPSQGWKVDTLTTKPVKYLSVNVTCKPQEIGMKLGESYGKLSEEMMSQGIKQSGAVFAIYKSYSPEKVEMIPAIPVTGACATKGEFIASETKSVKVMKVDYYGAYEGTEKVHYFMDEWAKKNSLIINGEPWEEYVTDPMVEKDTAKWLTRVYYPIQ